MKTALQHFNELPEPYGQMAIDETIQQGNHERLEWIAPSASQSISTRFLWRESTKGFDFWNRFYNELKHLESKTTDK